MADQTRYVNTDSTTGGDGTTNATGGANRAYPVLAEAVTDANANKVQADTWTIYLSAPSGVADTTAAGTLNAATEIDGDVYIFANTGQEAVITGWDTAIYTLEVDSADAIIIHTGYVWIDGLQGQVTGAADRWSVIRVRGGIPAATDFRFSNMRLRGVGSGTATLYGIHSRDDGNAYGAYSIWNVIAEDFIGGDGDSAAFFCDYATTYDVYNSLAYNSATGFERRAYTMNVENSVSFKNGDDFNGTITITKSASDDNDVESVAESGGGVEWPDDFAGAAAGDFTLVVGSNLIGAGTVDPSSGVFDDDIAGTTRGAAWDVGPFEFVAAGGVNVVPLLRHRRQMAMR